jgi:hypothetical protein
MLRMNWHDCFYRPAEVVADRLKLGGTWVDDAGESLDFGAPIGSVPVEALREAVERFSALMQKNCTAQLAFYVFMTTRQSQSLNGYYPLVNALDDAGRKAFFALAQKIMVHPGFDLRLLDERRANIASQLPEVAYFVAGHIAEIFFCRPDILERLLTATCRVWLYTSPQAFQNDGGVAGGSFNGAKGCVQLVLSRLYEGFYAPTPGVAPFLHEFGHLLDFLDAGRGIIDKSSGLLPGMRDTDGAVYKREARDLFLKGKRAELERYLRLYKGAPPADPLPIGHPYVFQNDTEFVAGYFEVFFRNPHYFAAQNPHLYQAFALTFGQDPRQYWVTDFLYYIQQNRGFYLNTQRPAKPGLALPL